MANGTSAPYPRCPKTVTPISDEQQAVPKYISDKSRIAVPVKPCVQRQFQVFLFALQSLVRSDLVVLHRYRCRVTTNLLVRPANRENNATTGNASGSTAGGDRSPAGPAGTQANVDRCGQSSRSNRYSNCPGSQRKSG